MSVAARLRYWRRIGSAYLLKRESQLTFWHETPAMHPALTPDRLGPYYMTFREKADYRAHLDAAGVPMLDYQRDIGLQYNPIAVAQYALANYNVLIDEGDDTASERFLASADWLVDHLEHNRRGFRVWNHHFDWEYRDRLVAPWYSGLAQGQGISALVRAHLLTGDEHYLDTAHLAFISFTEVVDNGGVCFLDQEERLWIEEYIVSPPTHILNGFMWALWGVHDYALATGDARASTLFEEGTRTLLANLDRYDIGYWSLYELSGTRLQMIASPFYHRLHVVQLQVMHELTGDEVFRRTADRWASYLHDPAKRRKALTRKILFKVVHY